MKIGLVASAGGHLAQLMLLRSWWEEHERFWVTFDKPDARWLLREEKVYWAAHPTNRNARNLWKNSRLAARVLAREQPDVLLSNGAGVALPFFFLGRALGTPLVFCEVYDRIDVPSLTGRIVAPLCDAVVIQWPEQRRAYPDAVRLGPML